MGWRILVFYPESMNYYDSDMSNSTVDFDNLFKVSRATMLTKGTMMKHSKKKNTLPKDLHYDADKLFRLFQKDKIMVSTGILY
jgi:hypothetical protein